MREVYRATDMKLGRDVALKILPPDVASDPERLARFQREARAVAALNHPNVVTLYSVGRIRRSPLSHYGIDRGQPRCLELDLESKIVFIKSQNCR
jgi:serine/threonine protein kinase